MLTHVPGYNVTTDSIRSKTVKDSYVKWDAGLLVNAVTTTNSSLTLDNSHDSFYINNANAATISVTILDTINDYTANSNNSLRRVNVIIDSRSAAADRTVTFTIPNTFTLLGGLSATRNLYHGNLQVFVVEIVNNTVNIYDGVGSYFEEDSNGDLMPLESNASLVPRTDLSGQLGTGDKRWAAVYAGNITNTYDSVADMVADTSLKEGGTAFTKGYHNPNDGGAGVYNIRVCGSGEPESCDNGSTIFLTNGNVAELITDGTVNVKQFGAKGDGVTDDTTAIQNAINYCDDVFVPESNGFLVSTVILHKNSYFHGSGYDSLVLSNTTVDAVVDMPSEAQNVKIKSIRVKGNKTQVGIMLRGDRQYGDCCHLVDDVVVSHCTDGIKYNTGCSNCRVINSNIYTCTKNGISVGANSDNRVENCEVGMVGEHGYYINGGNNVLFGNKDFLCGENGTSYYGLYSNFGSIISGHISQGAYHSAIYLGHHNTCNSLYVYGANYKQVENNVYAISLVDYNVVSGVFVDKVYGDVNAVFDIPNSFYRNIINLTVLDRINGGQITATTAKYFNRVVNLDSNDITINGSKQYKDITTFSRTVTSAQNVAFSIFDGGILTFGDGTNYFEVVVYNSTLFYLKQQGTIPPVGINASNQSLTIQQQANTTAYYTTNMPVYGNNWVP